MAGKQNKIIVLCGPSGSGKTTIARYLLSKFDTLAFSVSATTRLPRPGEQDGIDYYFLSPETFRGRINSNEFIEHEEVYNGILYGTLLSEIDRIWSQKSIPLLDIDVQGALNIKGRYGQQALTVFVHPGSREALSDRLEKRGTETEEERLGRLAKAEGELAFANRFDAIVYNHNLDEACKQAEQLTLHFLD